MRAACHTRKVDLADLTVAVGLVLRNEGIHGVLEFLLVHGIARQGAAGPGLDQVRGYWVGSAPFLRAPVLAQGDKTVEDGVCRHCCCWVVDLEVCYRRSL